MWKLAPDIEWLIQIAIFWYSSSNNYVSVTFLPHLPLAVSALYFNHVKNNRSTIVQNDFRSSCDYKHQFKVQSFDVADGCLLYLKVLPLIIDIFFVIKGVNVMHKIMDDALDTCSFIFDAKSHINVAMLAFLQKWLHSLVRLFVY